MLETLALSSWTFEVVEVCHSVGRPLGSPHGRIPNSGDANHYVLFIGLTCLLWGIHTLCGPRSTSTQLTLQPLKHRRQRRQNASRHRRTACYDIRHDPLRCSVMGTNYLRLRFLRERCGSAAKGNTSAAEPDGRQQVMAALQQGSELPTWKECARL